MSTGAAKPGVGANLPQARTGEPGSVEWLVPSTGFRLNAIPPWFLAGSTRFTCGRCRREAAVPMATLDLPVDIKVEKQHAAYEEIYGPTRPNDYETHVSSERLVRYLRDRRLSRALGFLESRVGADELREWSVLVVCGGAGGEGIFFLRSGFGDVTVSDVSGNSLQLAKKLEPRLKTCVLNAEQIELRNDSYDLVVVQDGLHHLPRPALGLTEMLRVAAKAVVVVEPHDSLVGNLIGTKWEVHDDAINYVYRWNARMVEQTVKSYLLQDHATIKVFRFWDHGLMAHKTVELLPKRIRYATAKGIYSLLALLNFAGNNMVCVVCK